MFDEDLEPQKKKAAKRNLDNMSVSELENYIKEMKEEIERVENDIARKKAHEAAAASVFK